MRMKIANFFAAAVFFYAAPETAPPIYYIVKVRVRPRRARTDGRPGGTPKRPPRPRKPR